jgi:hypothetical protein
MDRTKLGAAIAAIIAAIYALAELFSVNIPVV